jgi:putative membrane protein
MIFGEQDQARIEQAVRDAETRTSGEIVVAEVRSSAAYGAQRAIASAMLAAALATVLVLLMPHLPAPIVLLAQVPFFAAAWLVVALPSAQRLLAGARRLEAATRARAAQLFAERGVHVTRDRTGVLIMVSEVERRVVILADAGINARVGEGAWSAHVASITTAIRAGRPGDGVMAVIREIGELLARDFPRRPDDVNELPDRPVRES